MQKKKITGKQWVAASVALGTLVFGVTTYIVGDMVYAQTVGTVNPDYQTTDIHYIYQYLPEVIEAYETYTHEDLMIPSENGYDVQAKMLFAKEASEQTVVIVHGIGTNMWRHFREALMYLENGFNVVIYNQRYTDQTGGDNRTFGHLEKYDIEAVMNYVSTTYPEHFLGAHGFSMGAGTVGMYSGLESANEQADFIILDSPYDTMAGAIGVGIEAEGTPIPTRYAVWAGNTYNSIKSGFSYDEVDLKKEVSKYPIPMYVIIAGADAVCPPEMGEAVYDAKQEGYKDLWFSPGAEHVEIFDSYPEQYEENVMAFIKKVQEKE